MAPQRPVIRVELSLPVFHHDRVPLFHYMIKVSFDNETPMFLMEPQIVEPLFIGDWLERECLILGNGFAGGPPDLDAGEFIGNFFVVVHAEGQGLGAVLDHVGLEAARLGGGGGAEVGLDGGVGLATHETLAGELVEGYLDVRREESEELLRMFVDGGFEVVREILIKNCLEEHDCGKN